MGFCFLLFLNLEKHPFVGWNCTELKKYVEFFDNDLANFLMAKEVDGLLFYQFRDSAFSKNLITNADWLETINRILETLLIYDGSGINVGTEDNFSSEKKQLETIYAKVFQSFNKLVHHLVSKITV